MAHLNGRGFCCLNSVPSSPELSKLRTSLPLPRGPVKEEQNRAGCFKTGTRSQFPGTSSRIMDCGDVCGALLRTPETIRLPIVSFCQTSPLPSRFSRPCRMKLCISSHSVNYLISSTVAINLREHPSALPRNGYARKQTLAHINIKQQ